MTRLNYCKRMRLETELIKGFKILFTRILPASSFYEGKGDGIELFSDINFEETIKARLRSLDFTGSMCLSETLYFLSSVGPSLGAETIGNMERHLIASKSAFSQEKIELAKEQWIEIARVLGTFPSLRSPLGFNPEEFMLALSVLRTGSVYLGGLSSSMLSLYPPGPTDEGVCGMRLLICCCCLEKRISTVEIRYCMFCVKELCKMCWELQTSQRDKFGQCF
jgi:hypothetical protein